LVSPLACGERRELEVEDFTMMNINKSLWIAAALAIAVFLTGANSASARGGRGGGGGGGGGGYHGGGSYHGGGGYHVVGYHGGYGGYYHGGNYGYRYPGYYGGYGPYWYGSYYNSYPYGYSYAYPDYGSYSYTYPSYDTSAYEDSSPGQSYYYSPPASDSSQIAPAIANTAARIHMILPDAQAQVSIGGRPTAQTGTERWFHSPALQTGSTYTYQIRASWMQGGKQVSQERTVTVIPGQTTVVDFTQPAFATAR